MRLGINSFMVNEKTHDGPKIFLKRLKDSIKDNKLANVTNIFHPFFDFGIFSVLDKNIYKKKYILRVDGIYIDAFNFVGDSKKLNQVIFDKISSSSGIVFISEFSKKIVQTFYKKSLPQNIIIHNKVPIKQYSHSGNNARSILNIDKDSIVLITAAKWRRHKRLEETIKFLKILNQNENKYKLIVLGENNHNNKIENVYFVGPKKIGELPFWYRAADVYVHLCWIEACGNTQIEALACGVPVLCCNNGGIGETVECSKGGIVSLADKKYEFNEIDLYKPPEPDYKILKKDLEKILANYNFYKKNIDYNYLDIARAAEKYVSFAKLVNEHE